MPQEKSRQRGRPRSHQKKSRVHITYPASLDDRLREMVESGEADTIGDAVRDALALYIFLWTEHSAGSKLFYEDKDGDKFRLAPFQS